MDNNYNYNNQQQYQQYQQPVYASPEKAVMTVGDWMITTLVLVLPCIGLIMAFVWGFGSGNENRKNYCRAWLIWQAIAIVLSIIFSTVMGSIFAVLLESMMY